MRRRAERTLRFSPASGSNSEPARNKAGELRVPNAKTPPAGRVSTAAADRCAVGFPSESLAVREVPHTHKSGRPREKRPCGPRPGRPPHSHPASAEGMAEPALRGLTHSASWRRRSPPAAGGPRRPSRRAPAPPGAGACSTSGVSPRASGIARCGARGRWGRARTSPPRTPRAVSRRAGTRGLARSPGVRRPATSPVVSPPSPLS